MRWPFLFALPVACIPCATRVPAQSFVVPSRHLALAGNWYDETLTPQAANQPSHVQLIYDTRDIQPPAATVKQMEFRRTSALLFRAVPNPAALWDITLVLSMGPNGPGTASSTFAANLGNLTTTVFSGRVNLPVDASTTNPPPFTVQIPFTSLFLYLQASGAGLVADFRVTGYFPAGSQRSWLIDSQIARLKTIGTNGGPDPRCRFGANGNTGNTFGVVGELSAGSPVSIAYPNLLPRAPGVIVVGTAGQGGTWGGFLLPFDLGPLGAPGCFLRASIQLALAVQCDAAGRAASPTIVLPLELEDTGPYYSQGIFLDPSANDLGLMTTVSGSFTIGSPQVPRAARVSRLADTGMSPIGTVDRNAVVARFVQ